MTADVGEARAIEFGSIKTVIGSLKVDEIPRDEGARMGRMSADGCESTAVKVRPVQAIIGSLEIEKIRCHERPRLGAMSTQMDEATAIVSNSRVHRRCPESKCCLW